MDLGGKPTIFGNTCIGIGNLTGTLKLYKHDSLMSKTSKEHLNYAGILDKPFLVQE